MQIDLEMMNKLMIEKIKIIYWVIHIFQIDTFHSDCR